MTNYLKLLRVKHYIKNFFVFIPLIFSLEFFNTELVVKNIVVFVQFCFAASMVYIINDICDIEKDRLHPVKKSRPLASGVISVNKAKCVLVVLFLFEILSAFIFRDYISSLLIGLYLLLNLAYSFRLKRVPIVDVFILASGFLIRIFAGAFAIDVKVSEWLLLTAFALSLFLGFGKRYGEKVRSSKTTREVLEAYSMDGLRSYMVVTVGLTIVFYSLYCAIGNSVLGENAVYTIPIVVFAIFRYMSILEKDEIDGDPTDALLSDNVMKICVLLYGIILVYLLLG